MQNSGTGELFVFDWQGYDRTNHKAKGQLLAESEEQVEKMLLMQAISASAIKRQPKWLLKLNKKKIKVTDIMLFARQMATMINAGVPLVRAMNIVLQGVENLSMQELIINMRKYIESGHALSEAVAEYPQYFNSLFYCLVKAGEISGTLGKTLSETANYMERAEEVRSRVKKALMYPAVIFSVAFGVAFFMLVFVVPQFEKIYSQFDKALPVPTQMVINLSLSLQEYWWMYVAGVFVFMWFYKVAKRRSERFRYFIDKRKLSMPIFGKLLVKSIIARSSRTMAITIGAGIPIVQSLDTIAGVSSNLVYEAGFLKVRDRIREGETIARSLIETRLFPNMVSQMIVVGEESGKMEEMMYKISDYYEEQVNIMVDSMSTMIEPAMLVLLGIIVGGFIITMYLPIFNLGSIL